MKHNCKQKIKGAVLVSSLMDCFLFSFFKLMNNLEENIDSSLLTFAEDTNMIEVLNNEETGLADKE